MLRLLFEKIQFIHFYPHEYDILDKFTKCTIHSTSNKVIWSIFLYNFIHGLKSAILTIFQESADWQPSKSNHSN